jgi:hypothetical protein
MVTCQPKAEVQGDWCFRHGGIHGAGAVPAQPGQEHRHGDEGKSRPDTEGKPPSSRGSLGNGHDDGGPHGGEGGLGGGVASGELADLRGKVPFDQRRDQDVEERDREAYECGAHPDEAGDRQGAEHDARSQDQQRHPQRTVQAQAGGEAGRQG